MKCLISRGENQNLDKVPRERHNGQHRNKPNEMEINKWKQALKECKGIQLLTWTKKYKLKYNLSEN